MTYALVGWLLFCLGFVFGGWWATRQLQRVTVVYYAFGEEVGAVERIREKPAKAGNGDGVWSQSQWDEP